MRTESVAATDTKGIFMQKHVAMDREKRVPARESMTWKSTGKDAVGMGTITRKEHAVTNIRKSRRDAVGMVAITRKEHVITNIRKSSRGAVAMDTTITTVMRTIITITTIIMQMKCSQAGGRRQYTDTQRRNWSSF